MTDSANFTCPKCGGYKWGTLNPLDPENKWKGECHGGDTSPGCGFTWDRKYEENEPFFRLQWMEVEATDLEIDSATRDDPNVLGYASVCDD